MKGIVGLCGGAEGTSASANWEAFIGRVEAALPNRRELDQGARNLLLAEPPNVEIVRGGIAVFERRPLVGTEGRQLIEAARRVRNNLFHGGKEAVEARPGRDEALVSAALHVIQTAVRCDADVAMRFM
jgi:hypothetical protein